jgi:molybdopterin/thiamine biosynthesis adenylyltransferase
MIDLYSRQESIGLNVPEEVTVVGVGGIGSWAAIFLAMSGVKTLYLFDPDVMEESNRNRLPFCQGSLNRPKVEVVSEYIRTIRPDSIVVGIQRKLDAEFLDLQMQVSQTFLDCTDSPASQIRLYKTCKEHNKRFVRAGYDGTHITVTGVISGWIKNSEQEAYTVNPSWVVPAATVAALAVGKIMKYYDQETSLDISEIGIPVLERKNRLTARCTLERATLRRR